MHLFYTPQISGTTHLLDEQESKHAIRVLRLQEGDQVILVDGSGGWYEAEIREGHPKRCRLGVLQHQFREAMPYRLHIAMAPTKNMDRFEWFLEKAAEIGISSITPLLCERSERRSVKAERMERILVSAMKQSLKAFKPELAELQSLDTFLRAEQEGFKGIAHCMPTERIPLSGLGKERAYTFLVGPEGDFTEEEVRQALAAGYTGIDLGLSRLRTETSGVHICSAIQLLHS